MFRAPREGLRSGRSLRKLSADRCGSGKATVFSTAGPVAEPNVGGVRTGVTECPGIGGVVSVNVNSGPEDRSCVLTVVPEPVPSADAHALKVDDPCGDVVLTAGAAPVDGRLEGPVQRFPVFSSTAGVSPSQSATRVGVVRGSRRSAKTNVARADRSQHGEVRLEAADQLSRQPGPPNPAVHTEAQPPRHPPRDESQAPAPP